MLSGQYVNIIIFIDMFCIWVISGIFIQCDYIWYYLWCYFCFNMNFIMIVKDFDFIVVVDIVFLGIKWVDLYFLMVSCFQYINVVVS